MEEVFKAISMSCFPWNVWIFGILSLFVEKWHEPAYGIALIFKICLYRSPFCWRQRGRNIWIDAMNTDAMIAKFALCHVCIMC